MFQHIARFIILHKSRTEQQIPILSVGLLSTTTFCNSYCCRLPELQFKAARTKVRGPIPLTYQHWAGVSPYTFSFEFARTCVFDKQSANNHSLRPCQRQGTSSPEVTRSLFAEFLKPLSLARLSILYQPTCVGLRYGLLLDYLRIFSGKLNGSELP